MGELFSGLRDLPTVHPVFVHVPIVLLPLALILDLTALVSRRVELHRVARWALWLGTVGAGVAALTGHEAEEVVEQYLSEPAAATFEWHHDLGFITLGIAATASLWRLVVRQPFPSRGRFLYVVLAIASVATLIVGADLGGRLVYQHGVGVRVGADSLFGGPANRVPHRH
jgi:uncharacterized membrane protein